MGESEWNWPFIILFIILFGGIALMMAIPDGVTTVETCITTDTITRCTTVEKFT